jgi:4-hydroxy-2-oxoheptanedioate aldolase
MLNRAQIAKRASIAPTVTPMVRIPPNGAESNQWIAKQVLDMGVYGVIWPHISTVEEAKNAVAACRYPRPKGGRYSEPAGKRGDGPRAAAAYWGLSQQEYYERADVWPLNPNGEILVGIICEDVAGVRNLPQILDQVPGIGVVIVGEGDLSQELGYPRQYDHPEVLAAVDQILAACKRHGVACGNAHVDSNNIGALVERGFRWLMTPPAYSFALLEQGRKLDGR